MRPFFQQMQTYELMATPTNPHDNENVENRDLQGAEPNPNEAYDDASFQAAPESDRRNRDEENEASSVGSDLSPLRSHAAREPGSAPSDHVSPTNDPGRQESTSSFASSSHDIAEESDRFFKKYWRDFYAYRTCSGNPERTLYLTRKIDEDATIKLPHWRKSAYDLAYDSIDHMADYATLSDWAKTKIEFVDELPKIHVSGNQIPADGAVGVAVEETTDIAYHLRPYSVVDYVFARNDLRQRLGTVKPRGTRDREAKEAEEGSGGAPPSPNERGQLGGSTTSSKDTHNQLSDDEEADSGHMDLNRLEADSGGYLQTEKVGTTTQSNLMDQWTADISEGVRQASRELLIHCWQCYGFNDGGWIPISAVLMREGLTDCPRKTERVWRPLKTIGLIDVREQYFKGGKCRRFRMRHKTARALCRAGRKGKRRATKLHSGKQHGGRGAAHQMSVHDEHGNSWCWDPLTDALKVLKDARHVLNASALREALAIAEAHVVDEGNTLAHTLEACKKGKQTIGEVRKATETLRTERQRERAFLAAVSAIQDQITEDLGDGGVVIQNAYRVSNLSGRLVFAGGGPQSLPRPVKHRVYAGIEDLRNYDIRSCQDYGLRHLAEDLQAVGCDVDTMPLDDFLADDGKDGVVDRHGLPRPLVKAVLHAVKYGAVIPYSKAQGWKRKKDKQCEVLDHVLKYYDYEDDCTNLVLSILKDELGSIEEMVGEMGEMLVGSYWEAQRNRGGRGHHVWNACGITFFRSDWDEGHERRAKAMAWYLQGLEAAYCHAITAIQSDYDYRVIANEHDGVITIGEIPEEARARASEMSGFTGAKFVEKPFADEGEVKDFWGEPNSTTINDNSGRDRSRTDRPAQPPKSNRNQPNRTEADDGDE